MEGDDGHPQDHGHPPGHRHLRDQGGLLPAPPSARPVGGSRLRVGLHPLARLGARHAGATAGTRPAGNPGTLLWAVAPFLTASLGAAPCFAYAAIRLRNRFLGGCAAVYGAATASGVALSAGTAADSWGPTIGATVLLATALGASTHALVLRRTLDAPRSGCTSAIGAARARIRQRHKARRIVAKNPALAAELRIGRPDLARSYDDGGLVDVNHVPAPVLAALDGIGPDLAQRIVAARDLIGSFDSLADLEVTLGVAPQVFDPVADLVVFLR